MAKAADLEVLRSEILDLHRTLIDAHTDKDIDFFVRDLADDYMTVARGDINNPKVPEIRARFTDYLNNTTFTEYRDLREPIIRVSRDGSMAWSIVQVKIAGTRKMEDGSERELDFVCAWITMYEREGDRWLRVGEVSTFK